MKFPALDWSKIKTFSISERPNKVAVEDFGTPHTPGGSFAGFLAGLPNFLAASDFGKIVEAMANTVRGGKTVLLMMGAHPIKCGLNPILVDAMRSGLIHGVAFNGAGAIHDFETAFQGETSEDVQRGLDDGTFGMADETGRLMNAAMADGACKGVGAGQALGETMGAFPNRHLSILRTGVECGIPVTVHIALGTDIIHQHPTANGAALGEASFLDFQRFASVVATLEGGVVLNVGSAVIMPEVFLKALTVARNLGNSARQFTTATFDMIRQYRPSENVVRRPTHLGGRGYYIVGHHELMIPLLFAAVKERLAQPDQS